MEYPRLTKSAVRMINKGNRMKNRLLNPFSEKKGDGYVVILKFIGKTVVWKKLGIIQDCSQSFDTYRNKTTFEIANIDSNFGENEDQTLNEVVAIATHFAVMPQNILYSLSKGDEDPITDMEFTTKIYASRIGDKLTQTFIDTL